MSRTVSIDEMADAINEGLKEYATLASTQVKSAVRKSAKTVKDQISANAPSRTGAYKGSWVATKQSESSQSLQMVVHSKNRYQLAHLLEKVMPSAAADGWQEDPISLRQNRPASSSSSLSSKRH